jgi:hypothetical protein
MTSACRPLTAWRHLAALLCAAAPFVAGLAEAQPCGTCLRTSLGLAPRAYPAGDSPVAVAAGDLNGDGRADLVVVNNPSGAGKVRVLLGGPNGFVIAGTYDVSPVPRGVAIADFDTDGLPDVVVALGDGSTGQVWVLRNTGGGNLNPTPLVTRSAGTNTSAVVVGDFDGNGTPDVAAADEGSNQVFVFLGDGKGGLDSGHITSVGSQPRALVAGFFDTDGKLDLAVACAGDNQVRVLKGNGNGTFTTGAVVGVGSLPVSLAAADLEPDGDLDIVAANSSGGTVSILRNDGTGAFVLASSPAVGGSPTGVAVLQVDGNSALDIVTSNPGSRSVDLLLDDGAGGFKPATHHTVLMSPQAVVPVDANADGHPDLAVPCRASDAVVVLVARPPGPPAFSAAVRYTVGTQPASAVAADLDGVNGPDLAVANEADSTVSILLNTGSGSLTTFGLPRPVLSTPSAIVAGDFDRDGVLDLAVSSTSANKVSVLRGTGLGNFAGVVSFDAGSGPDDLVAVDVDGDGDLDLLVCNRVPSGQVALLRNTSSPGSISFDPPQLFAVGPDPTSIFVGRLNGDAFVDLAVANSTAARLTVLYGDSPGHFDAANPTVLNLTAGDANPTSIVGADFDGDGKIDLAATVLNGSAVSVFRNNGTSFAQPPTRIPAMDIAVHAVAADLNLDGKIDLAIAATGFEALRGRGSATSFEAGEDFVAGVSPSHVAVADFSRDGLPDIAVVNRDSNDVSILLGTACTAQRLEVTQQPAEAACLTGLGPFSLQAIVEAHDDGGNLACPAADVTATIVPGTGTAGASLTGTVNTPPRVPLTSGVASFTGATDSLTLDKSGRRYRLQFSLPSLPGVPPVLSHTFTLGAQPVILGPNSFCPGSQATYAADPTEGSYDEYRWTLDGAASPFAFSPSIILKEPPTLSLGSHSLALDARVDSCTLSAPPRTIWYRTWQNTSLSTPGVTTVCVDCLGGTVTPTDQGGGAVVSRQWGYRLATLGAITSIGGETAATYTVKGTDFPGPGTYYLVVTTAFTCPTTPSVSAELPVVVTAQVATSEVQFLAVTSRGTGASGENHLLWVNSTGTPEKVRIRWNKAPSGTSACVPPVDPVAGTVSGELDIDNPPQDTKGEYLHSPLEVNTAYCYAVFVRKAGIWAPGRIVKARPFDASGPVKWAYSTGATAVVPPVISTYGILALSNDRTVHEVTRGSAGGVWPALWVPHSLAGVAYSRSPVVPFSTPVGGADTVLFLGDDSGDVRAFDARTGQSLWGSPIPPNLGKPITGAPAGLFQQYGGIRDVLLFGTRNGAANELYGRNLADGSSAGTAFSGAGAIAGGPAVDYTTQRVYFASRSYLGGPTLWCVQVGTSPLFAPVWSRNLGDIDGSPVLRNGRVYFGTNSGIVYSLDAATGSDDRLLPTGGDGPVKGFLFPDRRNNNLFFATNTKVWSVSDTAGVLGTNWTWTMPAGSPSIVLYWPQTSYVYVGGGNGTLWQLDSTYMPGDGGFAKSLTLGDGTGQIGAPTLDIGVTPKLLVVGSESGALYGVEVPLP